MAAQTLAFFQVIYTLALIEKLIRICDESARCKHVNLTSDRNISLDALEYDSSFEKFCDFFKKNKTKHHI